MSKMRQAYVCGELRSAPEGDYFVICSFDSNHILLRSRMPYHIIKCVKNHPGHNKIQCPYDATEYLDPEEYPSHIIKCESKRSLSTGKFETAALKASGNLCNIKQTPFFHQYAPEPEDWGLDVGETFNAFEEGLQTLPLKGVGRGVSRQTSPPKKGRGRAELLSRFMKIYEERQAATSSSSSLCCSANSNSARDDVSLSQFEDSWDD